MTEPIHRIAALCKAGVFISINEHRNYYESVTEWLDNHYDTRDVTDDIRAEMIRTNTTVEISAYPDTPVGCYVVLHHDLATALQRMVEILEGT